MDESKQAIIIDPGEMDENLLNLIESNHYQLQGVFITHDHLNHVRGLRTMKRIYDVEVFSINPSVHDIPATIVRDGEHIRVGDFDVEVITCPGHSTDSAIYKISTFLFTGDALSAGLLGTTNSSYGEANQINALTNKVFSLPGNYGVFGGHGPPSSLEAERRFNFGLRSYQDHKNRKPRFKIEL
jgi:glyoxylase-like metal-dependent hydrolase (beta-lactamase superfamily II)